jgi:integrase/recombinase XerD
MENLVDKKVSIVNQKAAVVINNAGNNDAQANNDLTNQIQIVNRQNDDLPIYFTEDELRQFFDVIPASATRDKVFFLTLIGTGKRISEILSWRRKDIDLENRRIKTIVLKKRRRKEEYIRLHPDIAYWLSIYIGSMKADDRIFDFTRQYADRLCKKYARMAGITYKRASCHVFRHTFSIRWLEQGKPIHKLQRHLGHSFIMTTMKYLRIVNQDLFETVDSLEMVKV